MRTAGSVGITKNIGNDDEGAYLNRRRDEIGIAHRDERIGRYDPQGPDAAFGYRLEYVDRLQAGFSIAK